LATLLLVSLVTLLLIESRPSSTENGVADKAASSGPSSSLPSNVARPAPDGGRVEFQVTGAGGNPVEGAFVILSDTDESKRISSRMTEVSRFEPWLEGRRKWQFPVMETDSSGKASCERPSVSPYFAIAASIERLDSPLVHWSESVNVGPRQDRVHLRLRRAPQVIVEGNVTDGSGRAAEACRIDLKPLTGTNFSQNYDSDRPHTKMSTVTDRNGHYRMLGRIAPDMYTINAHGADYEPFFGGWGSSPIVRLDVKSNLEDQHFNVDITIDRLLKTHLLGRVVDQLGNPVPSSKIAVVHGEYDNNGGTAFYTDYARPVDEEGRFDIIVTRPQCVFIRVFDTNHESLILRQENINPNRIMDLVHDLGAIQVAAKKQQIVGVVKENPNAVPLRMQVIEWLIPEDPTGSGDQVAEPIEWSVPISADGTFSLKVQRGMEYRFSVAAEADPGRPLLNARFEFDSSRSGERGMMFEEDVHHVVVTFSR
jgi:protocatechuate 3,4-dioxygenase beta subunit